MTAEEIVKSACPKATAIYMGNNHKSLLVYRIYETYNSPIWFGRGETEEDAWADAAKRITAEQTKATK